MFIVLLEHQAVPPHPNHCHFHQDQFPECPTHQLGVTFQFFSVHLLEFHPGLLGCNDCFSNGP